MEHSARVLAFASALCVGVVGCATCPEEIRTSLSSPRPEQSRNNARAYTLNCPDRLAIEVEDHPAFSGAYVVESDGCVSLGGLGRIRVEVSTIDDLKQFIAGRLLIPTERIHIDVIEFASRHLLVFGPADGVQQVVPYQGPETLTSLLRRTGGLAEGAAFDSIYVVRPHVADGRRPEVFQVDLKAILVENDARTDPRLEPNDQIYLGETRGSSVARCMPPWLQNAWPGMKFIDRLVGKDDND